MSIRKSKTLTLRTNLVSAALAVTAVAVAGSAHADSAKDLQVAGRALTFLENGPTGRAVLGVVFDPAKPASVAEKNAVMAAIGGGYSAGALTLTGKAVEAGDVAGAAGVNALFITGGVNYANVGAVAKARKLVTIGSGPACVSSGACVMGVTTDPKVEIIVNRSAAAAVGVAFKAAFRMMIKEI
jgi:hypothetical protein